MIRLFKILGISDSASWNDVRQAYRRQLKLWHPDRYAGDREQMEQAEERTKALNEAFSQLREIHKERKSTILEFSSSNSLLTARDLEHEKANNQQVGDRGYGDSLFRVKTATTNQTDAKKSNLWGSLQQGASAVWVRFGRMRTNRQHRQINIAILACTFLACIATLGFARWDIVLESVFENRAIPLSTTAVLPQPSNYLSPIEPLQKTKTPSRERSRLLKIQRPKLIQAIAECNTGKTERLLAKGASVNTQDHRGESALSWAARRNCVPIAKILIKKGANLHSTSANGFTAYDWANWYGNRPMAALLKSARSS